ncbi:hypothetical protein OAY11_02895, partial [Pelagibacteraceae bacterium]|nr:hypothetical protein [Pelagibacteraceae bacterium]
NKIINSDFKLFLSHELCWFENIVIANICNKKRINVHLSSHGSHTITEKKIDDFSVNLRADGMLFSDLANINIVQSKKAYEYMQSRKPEFKILKNRPIIWGVAKYLNKELPNNNSKNFVILHASTCKKFGGRHWIYENSFEYIENINFLIKKLSNYQNVKLIIRFRENIDNKFELTKNLLIKSKNVEFKLAGNFYEDVMRSNLIVSFSSTVIEESLYLKKPVALFGNDHYRHINHAEGTKNNIMKSVYSLNRNNFDENIKKIISKHNNNLTKNEIQNYCFTEADSNEYENFIENFLNEKSNTF